MLEFFKKVIDLSFWFKVIVLFSYIYEFVPKGMPPIMSSRKISFCLILVYFIIKKGNFVKYFRVPYFSRILYLCIICIAYILFLGIFVQGHGVSILSWYIFFLLYGIICIPLFVCFFDGDIEKFLLALGFVTLLQSIWCILTYFIFDIRILNDVLFEVDEDENISFLTTSRLRSIGGAGSGLSVIIALSSFSYCYFIIKNERVIFNLILLAVACFAVMLVGTVGLIICSVLVVFLFFIVIKQKNGLITEICLIASLYGFFFITDNYLSDYEYDKLTYKFVNFFTRGTDEDTMVRLQEQKISPINSETLIGTGISRGIAKGGSVCFHDGGYYRNYFGIGLLMAFVFYSVVYYTMFKMAGRLNNDYTKKLLLLYLFIMIIIEYKEPYFFKYSPFMIFFMLFLASKNFKRL